MDTSVHAACLRAPISASETTFNPGLGLTGPSTQTVPVVPGTCFRIMAPAGSGVQVNHVSGWTDVATLTEQSGRGWEVAAANEEAAGRIVYDVRPSGKPGVEVDASSSALGGNRAAAGAGARRAAGKGSETCTAGLVRLEIPEKYISLDISSTGGPVAVSRVVEGDLRVVSAGGAVTLGSVRGMRVEVDTATAATTAGNAHGASGAVKGGDVSGTNVSITASGPITVRRLVGGYMQLTTSTTPGSPTTSSSSSKTAVEGEVSVSAASEAINLGAVYGNVLRIRTDGGAVRIGTLDCGGGSGDSSGAGDANSSDSSSRSTATQSSTANGFGAQIMSYGGDVCLEGLEGVSEVDSGGGAIKVQLQSRLASAVLRSGGGNVELQLPAASSSSSSGLAIDLLEVRAAGRLSLQPELMREFKQLPPPPEGDTSSGGSSGNGGSGGQASRPASVHVWRAALLPEASQAQQAWGGRGGASAAAAATAAGAVSGGSADGGSASGGGGVVVVVDAGGGEVSVRRVSWMEAQMARMAAARGTAGSSGSRVGR
ncbi:hypothetical protein Agub_g7117 [Astrephomene gubernaculifera]|uniref:Adhesin domain-containing protein n=1 Tax=Astrephomene gubernaculifera TaxID=47775 RepID=A0AAD3HM37_9CHLO|nr:hypothetical protein Agub_g7117 [Astrephomene gubernaculifera]